MNINIIAHGIDIVEIHRLTQLLQQSAPHFEPRCFTVTELTVAGSAANRIQFLAGRLAAKEAVLKTLGTGWSQGTSWTDIEIQQLPTGQPFIVLYSRCQEIAATMGISQWLVSISHTQSYALASVIALGSL